MVSERCEHFLFSVTFTFGDMWRHYLPCSLFQSDSLTLGWVTCCLRIEIAVVTLWISVASTISASPSQPSLPCSISTAANMSQVWPQTHFSFFFGKYHWFACRENQRPLIGENIVPLSFLPATSRPLRVFWAEMVPFKGSQAHLEHNLLHWSFDVKG